ncbi:MAG TPA: hypothetical protein VGQ91_09480, partial [Ideonella sp.]|nr:hypothetical protein [Ideonella sp.]
MRISTRFAVIGAVCALASAAIGVALVASNRQVAEEIRKNRATADIVESVAGLGYLTLEYARRPEERVERQWAGAHESLGRVLARSSEFNSKEERASFALMRAAYDESTKTFAELIRAQRARQAGEGDPEVMDELLRRLTAATTSRTLFMMTESFRLQDIGREEVAAAQRSVLIVVILLSATLVVVVSACMYFAFRSIARP